MQVKAILFDFDGTLADTMQNHYLCWKQSLGEFGVMIRAQDYYPMEGASLFRIAEKFTGSKEQSFIEKVVERNKKEPSKSSNITYQDAKELKRKQNKLKNTINRAEQKIEELE